MSSIAIGAVTAVLSAVFNGSFAAITKIPNVAKHDLDPILFMCYFTLGFFLFTWLTVPLYPVVYAWDLNNASHANGTLAGGEVYVWSNWGILAGLFQDLALTFSFLTIPRVGLSIGQGVWGGMSIIVAVIAGLVVLGNHVVNPAGLGCALVILLGSVAGIAFCNEIGEKFAACKNRRGSSEDLPRAQAVTSVTSVDAEQPSTGADRVLLDDMPDTAVNSAAGAGAGAGAGGTQQPVRRTPKDFALGITFAALVGIFGGSILVPLNYAAPPAQGIVFVPSQGIGAMIFAPVIAVVWFLARRQKPEFHLRATLFPGIMAGVIWGLGDVCSVFAIPFISYAVAYPILQCALLISGLWGVVVFKEVRLCAAKVTFFVAGVVLIGGAFLLALSVSA